MLDERQRSEALAVGLIALGILLVLALVSPQLGAGDSNLIGPAGHAMHGLLSTVFGWAAVVAAVPAFVWGIRGFGIIERALAVRASILAAGLLLVLPAAGWLLSARGPESEARVGRFGHGLGELLVAGFGEVGAMLIVGAGLVALPVLTLGWSPVRVSHGVGRLTVRGFTSIVSKLGPAGRRLQQKLASRAESRRQESASPWAEPVVEPVVEPVAEPVSGEPAEVKAEEIQPVDAEASGPLLMDPGDLDVTALPSPDLLSAPPHGTPRMEERQLRALGDILIDKLATFRVEGRIGGWTAGPAVTQFEVVPAAGVKVGQIAALSDDLALALKAPSVRIVAPIPGKGAVGVEVPNPQPEIVYLREILESEAYTASRGVLPLALGRDLAGRPYAADLARMPHLLIAGATGSGKSVCINTIITSLIYRYSPADLRLLMVDPKMVELSVYNDLPHLRHPVVIDNSEAATILKWVVFEMQRRYGLLSANSCRNVLEFNRRVRRGDEISLPPGRRGDYSEGTLPFIVLLIDELADLMMTVQSEVETPLALLAQKARAVGIHLVVATQRPSVDVLTGLIKANFACRIAFRVASKIDSRTILDQNGAESLLGNGDMLFLPPGESDPHRVQGAFLTTRDTEKLVAWYREQAALAEEPSAGSIRAEPDILAEVRQRETEEQTVVAVAGARAGGDRDPYFRQAAEVVINNNGGSTSLLQRRLKIGYGRAARIVDQLYELGVLGPPDGSRPREVLVTHEQLEALLSAEDAGT